MTSYSAEKGKNSLAYKMKGEGQRRTSHWNVGILNYPKLASVYLDEFRSSYSDAGTFLSIIRKRIK